MAFNERRRQILEEAWIGDAVLCLYCRDLILKRDGVVDGDKFTRMTSNQFLSTFGEPSHVEAEIGRVYEREGLAGARSCVPGGSKDRSSAASSRLSRTKLKTSLKWQHYRYTPSKS